LARHRKQQRLGHPIANHRDAGRDRRPAEDVRTSDVPYTGRDIGDPGPRAGIGIACAGRQFHQDDGRDHECRGVGDDQRSRAQRGEQPRAKNGRDEPDALLRDQHEAVGGGEQILMQHVLDERSLGRGQDRDRCAVA
jgi:hypothetical protein